MHRGLSSRFILYPRCRPLALDEDILVFVHSVHFVKLLPFLLLKDERLEQVLWDYFFSFATINCVFPVLEVYNRPALPSLKPSTSIANSQSLALTRYHFSCIIWRAPAVDWSSPNLEAVWILKTVFPTPRFWVVPFHPSTMLFERMIFSSTSLSRDWKFNFTESNSKLNILKPEAFRVGGHR